MGRKSIASSITSTASPFLRSSHSVGKYFASSNSLLGLANTLPYTCQVLAWGMPWVCEGILSGDKSKIPQAHRGFAESCNFGGRFPRELTRFVD